MSQPGFDFGDVGEDGDLDDHGSPTYSVGELAEAINGALQRRFDDGVWVRGEIQGWNERGGHAYFQLVEDGEDGKATLNVQFFANNRMRFRPVLQKAKLRLGNGLKVRIHGRLDFYAPFGRLGLTMDGIDTRFTLGDLALQRDDVVRRLVAGGLYDRNRRLPLSPAPLRVGVVTSLASAAWADFLHEVERSGIGFQLRVVDVRVQGEWAVTEVTAGLRTLGRATDLDAVVVIRGGGSRTELATFDHEAIATAIATAGVPVLTGLGHEIDRSVADEVAHLALKTPTACAAALVERVQAFEARMEAGWEGVLRQAAQGLGAAQGEVAAAAGSIRHRVVAAVDRSTERLAHRAHRVGAGATRTVERAEARVAGAGAVLARTPARLDPEARHLDALAERVRLLDPATTMSRGWSITRTADGRTVRHAADLAPGDLILTTFADGTARSRVEETTS